MAERLEKLRPDRDLQCYFEQPSAVAALSEAGAGGFAISGCWRQQFDWAVLEWNRDNVFEHPSFRNLPDGNLSGLTLSYEETRTNCIPIDCDLYPGDWAYLRVWPDGEAQPRFVRLRDYATAIEGTSEAASAEVELTGTATAGDYVGLAWLTEQYYHELSGSDTIESAAAALTDVINALSPTMHAARSGAHIVLSTKTGGANWNRVGVYGYVSGARTESWSPWWVLLSGGASPAKWRIDLNFAALLDRDGNTVPMTAVRKMRWTYAAGWQDGAFVRSEFEVRVSNWTVSGTNRGYRVAGPASRRIEDEQATYSGVWAVEKGNYSGGSIRYTTANGAQVSCAYNAGGTHTLLLGTRLVGTGAEVAVRVDGNEVLRKSLAAPLEDALVRIPLGEHGAGPHTVTAESLGPEGNALYFDFLEVAAPAEDLPAPAADARVSLATDWDTYHSICLAPERTAWMIAALGFHGRVNHYVGAMWFYELVAKDYAHASGQVTWVGTPTFGGHSEVQIGSDPPITHLHYIGDTAATVAKAFELEINRGSNSVRATAAGGVLTIYARRLGAAGNAITIRAAAYGGGFEAQPGELALSGGADGEWTTDVEATPRVNRAARDWHRSYFAALAALGLGVTAALSMELRHGDASVEAGLAQRCPAGDPVLLPTPALQTNFSPASLAFWREAYRDIAGLMANPYLQFGEVQWWYFREGRSGMPFYDAYTQSAFQQQYGHAMATILEHTVDPQQYPQETAFLPTLIGALTSAVIQYVRQTYAACRFEVLYPLDVNETAFNHAINYPAAEWTPATLDCLKTENFGYTYARNLDKCRLSIREPGQRGFPPGQSAHLVGISDPTTPWQREVRLARAEGLESVVLFALDQFCLIGYAAPLPRGSRRSWYQGG